MTKWHEFTDRSRAVATFREIARNIQTGSLDLGRPRYAQCLALGVLEAIYCGYGRLFAAELGVWEGTGLLDLCRAAQFFRSEFDIEILVWGFDTGAGLPKAMDYRDHPEWFVAGNFAMGDAAALRRKLPEFATLSLGDVADTIPACLREIGDARLAFVAVDLDLYSSTKRAMTLFTASPDTYLPAVPLYFDDMISFLLRNPWCGEELAVREFNEENALRKIARHDAFRIRHFHALHVLDHPLRTGQRPLRPGFNLAIEPLI
jgi:hypothetical protein